MAAFAPTHPPARHPKICQVLGQLARGAPGRQPRIGRILALARSGSGAARMGQVGGGNIKAYWSSGKTRSSKARSATAGRWRSTATSKATWRPTRFSFTRAGSATARSRPERRDPRHAAGRRRRQAPDQHSRHGLRQRQRAIRPARHGTRRQSHRRGAQRAAGHRRRPRSDRRSRADPSPSRSRTCNAVDPDDDAKDLTFTVSNARNGFVTLSGAPGRPVAKFTQADLQGGRVTSSTTARPRRRRASTSWWPTTPAPPQARRRP